MKQIEATGKTIEEALGAGLKELGCTIGDVTWVPIQEGSKGLFGLFGSRPAKVLITLNNEDDASSDIEEDILATLTQSVSSPKPAPKPIPRPKAEPPKPAPKAVVKPAPEAKPQPRQEPQAVRPPVQAPSSAKAATPAPLAKPAQAMEDSDFKEEVIIPIEAPTEPPVIHPADTTLGCAQQFLMQLTELMGVAVQVYASEDADKHLYVKMHGDTLGVLIGRRGETLDAVQYLTSLVVNRGREDYVRVTLDTENYRAKREETLRRLAMRMANRAVKTGRRVVLEPMNPYERRILHASLQGHPHVTTHSEGEEPNRRIVITLKK